MQFLRKVFIVCLLLSPGLFVYTLKAQDTVAKTDSSQMNRKSLFRALTFTGVYYAGAMIVLQNTWYHDREVVPFHFFNDNKGYLQVDKFGHAFGAYVESYIGYHLLLNSGVPKTKALLYGGSLGLVLQTPIEIMDGIHEGWGFSWGDMAANAIGSGLVIGNELLFHEQVVKYKFSYSESSYYLLSLDIDWTKIKTNSGFLKVVLKGMTFIKLPFPALEYNSKGKFRGYWMYF
jgi:hypothetical protein